MEDSRLIDRRMPESSCPEIRCCQPEDFHSILPLLHQLWPALITDESSVERTFNEALLSSKQLYLTAIVADRIVGFGSLSFKHNLWVHGLLAHVDELVVDAAYRGEGVGARLLAALESAARERGARRIQLDSGFHRKVAHEWYRRHGFSDGGIVFSKALAGQA